MDLGSMNDVRHLVVEQLKSRFAEEDCPVCKAETTMLKVYVSPLEGEPQFFEYLRCMKCNTLFKQVLEEVED